MPEGVPDAFLSFDYSEVDAQGKKLQGESVDKQAPNWFNLTSFSFSLNGAKAQSKGKDTAQGSKGQSGKTPAVATGKDSDTTDQAFPAVEITMPMQIGSPWLMKLCTQFGKGTPDEVEKLTIKAAMIWVRRAGMSALREDSQSGQDWFLQITLGRVTIASYRTSIECQDTFSLNYESMTIEYWRSDPTTGEVLLESPKEAPDAPWYQDRKWDTGKPKDAD